MMWTGSYIRSYLNLFSSTGKQGQDEGNNLTRDEFADGYTFFGFDITPDACDGDCFHLVRKGNLRIEIHFATALTHTVNVVAYSEFEAVLEIDNYLQLLMETDQIRRLIIILVLPPGVVSIKLCPPNAWHSRWRCR